MTGNLFFPCLELGRLALVLLDDTLERFHDNKEIFVDLLNTE